MDTHEIKVEAAETIREAWGLSLQPAGCPQCGQVYLLPVGQSYPVCPACAGAGLQPQPVYLRQEAPESVIPFKVQREALGAIFSQFTSSVWLRPPDFNAAALLERALPVFIPMWLVDSDLQGEWQAEMGFDYQVKSSQESFNAGSWQTQERIERRMRWEPRLGTVNMHYDNTVAPALSDHHQVSENSGKFTLREAQGYEPGLLQGAAVRAPDLNTEQAWPIARDALERRLAGDCQQAAGAQHTRRFTSHIAYAHPHWSQLLLPLHVSWYSDDEGRRRLVYVNGQTGQAGGLRLASQRVGWRWAGIIAAAAAILFLLALLAFALAALFPPASAIGLILGVLALVTGVAAIVPAAWPWQWNRRQLNVSVREQE